MQKHSSLIVFSNMPIDYSMMLLTTPEPTVRPPSRNRFTVLYTILSLIFLVFQRFCLLKACAILVTLKIGAILEPLFYLICIPLFFNACLNLL